MDVKVCTDVRNDWPSAGATSVRQRVFDPFLDAWQKRCPHWDVVDANQHKVRAVLSLDVLTAGEDELLTGIMLRIYKPSDPTSCDQHLVAQDLWYEPGDRMTLGVPDPNETVAQLKVFLKKVFPGHTGASDQIALREEMIREEVPLATTARWLGTPDRKFVLPLPRQRYNHLRLSKFRIRPTDDNGPQSSVGVEASGEWDAYDPNLDDALVARPADPNQISWPPGYRSAEVLLDTYKKPRETGGWNEYEPD
jgi:hypothetical protein